VDIVCSFDELIPAEVVSTNSVTTREVESTYSVTTTGAEELDPKPNDETSNSGKIRNI
jgi:hypothetical protein